MAATGTPQSDGSALGRTRDDGGNHRASPRAESAEGDEVFPGEREAASNRDAFWAALARGDREVAMGMLERINPPLVVYGTASALTRKKMSTAG